jgi:hypothetical protein
MVGHDSLDSGSGEAERETGSVVSGMVVTESRRVSADLNVLITGLWRAAAGNTVDGQPVVWTMCTVSWPEGEANASAAQLADALEPGPGHANLAGPRDALRRVQRLCLLICGKGFGGPG